MGFGGPGVHPLALSPGGSRVVLGWDHHLASWSADGEQAAGTVEGWPKGVYGLAFAAAGETPGPRLRRWAGAHLAGPPSRVDGAASVRPEG